MTATEMNSIEKEIRDLKMEIFHLDEKIRYSWRVNGGFSEDQVSLDERKKELKERVICLSKDLFFNLNSNYKNNK